MRLLPLFLFACGFSTSVAFAQPDQTPTTVVNPPVPTPPVFRVPRPAAPQAQIELDLKSFFAALNAARPDSLAYDFVIPQFVSGGRAGYFGLSEWTNFFVAQRGSIQYRLDQVQVEKLEGDTARVKVIYSLLSPKNAAAAVGPAGFDIVADEETLDLKREIVPWNKKEAWRIVPPSFETLRNRSPLALSNVAYHGSQREGTLTQLRARISISRLKHVALGAIQLSQDYDQQLAFQNEFWRDATRPYLQNDAILLIPGTQTPYTFNDNLSDKSLAAVRSPAQTVLFYEGETEKPTFRYDGKAAICFTDGHVKLVSPEEAKSLIWKP